MKPIYSPHNRLDRFVDANTTSTLDGVPDHFADAGKMVMPSRATDHFVGGNKMVGVSFYNPNGIESISPGLERSDYPGWTFIATTTPTGLRQVGGEGGCNPFRVGDVCGTVSQGSSCLATLGWMTESRWDSRTDAPLALDLEQTIVGNVAEILEA